MPDAPGAWKWGTQVMGHEQKCPIDNRDLISDVLRSSKCLSASTSRSIGSMPFRAS
jgi:hypothetical protein